MRSSLIVILVPLGVKSISIFDTPPPVEQVASDLDGLEGQTNDVLVQHGNQALGVHQEYPLGKSADQKKLYQAVGQQSTGHLAQDRLESEVPHSATAARRVMYRHLGSASEEEAHKALETVRSKLLHELEYNKNWRSEGDIALVKLKELQAFLLSFDAFGSTDHDISQGDLRLLEKGLEVVQDLYDSAKLPADRLWLRDQVKTSFQNSHSHFLEDKYLEIVRMRMAHRYKFRFYKDLATSHNQLPGHYPQSFLALSDQRQQLDLAQLCPDSAADDIRDFVKIYNARNEHTDVLVFHEVVKRMRKSLEAGTSHGEDPENNHVRLDLIALASKVSALKVLDHSEGVWISPAFGELISLTNTAREPEERIKAEQLTHFLKEDHPHLRKQFVLEYPLILTQIIERELLSPQPTAVFSRLLANGADRSFRQAANGLSDIFKKLEELTSSESQASKQAPADLPISNVALRQPNFAHEDFWNSRILEVGARSMDNKLIMKIPEVKSLTHHPNPGFRSVRGRYTELADELRVRSLEGNSCPPHLRKLAGEMLFAAGLLAANKVTPNVAGSYRSILRSSWSQLKQLQQNYVSGFKPTKYSSQEGALAREYAAILARKRRGLIEE